MFVRQKLQLLTKLELSHMIENWEDQREKEQLNKPAIKRDVERLGVHSKTYNVPVVDSILEDNGYGKYRFVYYQKNNASTKEVRGGRGCCTNAE